jgi:predicted outer membrane repeat protein
VEKFLTNQSFLYTTTLYFSSPTTKVYAYANDYTYFLHNHRGGVYLLDSVYFEEQISTYTNNSAVLGGAISCASCTMNVTGNHYSNNMANYGGTVYLESDAFYYSFYENFKSNSALNSGGGIFATTRTLLYMTSSLF